MILPYRILERKRAGLPLSEEEIRSVVRGTTDGSWTEGQLGAFLMASAIRGMTPEETRALTLAMLESGTRWNLAADVPGVCDKHSTGGVGDKISLILAPLLASCGVPIAMLAGRGLGHTAGTIDKLEVIPGMDLQLDRAGCVELLRRCNMAIGGATAEIAPADRRFYALRDVTATVDSLPLITGSILSKKLATGAAAVVFDVKTGNGAFLPDRAAALELARSLVETAKALGTPASALLTDMNQPMGRWTGHAAEVMESLACLEGSGPGDVVEVTLLLAEEVARLAGHPVGRPRLEKALADGRAREHFNEWAELQGADPAWLRAPRFELAPVEIPILAPRAGHLATVATRHLGLLLVEAGCGRSRPEMDVDFGVSLEMKARLGDAVEEGQELARVYLRKPDERLAAHFQDCFTIADTADAPVLLIESVR
jgi:pyrimidine-nucleoside phosphorylase